MYTQTIQSPIGKLDIIHDDQALVRINMLSDAKIHTSSHSLFKQIHEELESYFANATHQFTLPLAFNGTAFQKQVWQALLSIPAGSPQSYRELAEKIHSGARAVGNACRQNPIPIIAPCHRIVAQRDVGGYAGATHGPLIRIKQWLLNHEAH